MKTKVTVHWYKESGKWYTSTNFETDTPVWDSPNIERDIQLQNVLSEGNTMPYTYEADNGEGAVNRRLVIKTQ